MLGNCSLKLDCYQLDDQQVSSSTGLMWALSNFTAFPFQVLHCAYSRTEQGLSLNLCPAEDKLCFRSGARSYITPARSLSDCFKAWRI